jgi:outer membrane protein TolC
MPLIGRMEARRFEQPGARAMNVLSLAADTRKAWVTALAAEETVRYMRQVKQAAEASAELARRMEQVGNFNKLQRRANRASMPTPRCTWPAPSRRSARRASA